MDASADGGGETDAASGGDAGGMDAASLDAGRDGGEGGVTPGDAGMPRSCAEQGRLPPPTWTRERQGLARDLDATTETWEQMFGAAFPRGQAEEIRVREGRYLALELSLSGTELEGQIGFSDLGGNITTISQRPALVTISRCPGDFTAQADADCRVTGVGGEQPAFLWTRSPGDIVRCELTRGETLYFNVTFVAPETEDATDPAELVWQCDAANGEPCGWRLSPTFVE